MHSMTRFVGIIAVAFTLFSVVSGVQYNVTVGQGNENVYDPPSISNVNTGDVIRFQFATRSHSVTESSFERPCTPRSPGRDSGVVASTSATPYFSITIDNGTASDWFYCVVGTHCSGSGMVFAINPTSGQTYDAYKARAMGKTITSAGSSATGTSYSAGVQLSVQRTLTAAMLFSIGALLWI